MGEAINIWLMAQYPDDETLPGLIGARAMIRGGISGTEAAILYHHRALP
jgi:hypothetical protein